MMNNGYITQLSDATFVQRLIIKSEIGDYNTLLCFHPNLSIKALNIGKEKDINDRNIDKGRIESDEDQDNYVSIHSKVGK